ncbi:HpsJ family protein [Cyanobium sp. FGCU-52]|nr:HpsJ family protein [Cyanobium sp. FGCU52]
MTSFPVVPTEGLGPDLPRLLRWAGLCLLGLFALGVVSSLLPLALMSSAWQLQQIQTLLQQGPMALIGLALVGVGRHLADLDLSERRAALLRRLVLAVALGYGLLIPLQLFATWNQWKQAASREAAGRERLRSRLETLDRQVSGARDDAQLQRLLRQLPVAAPSLEQLGANPQARRRGAQVLLSRLSDGVALELRRREERQGMLVFRSSLRNALAALLLSVAWLMVAAPRPRLALPWRREGAGSGRRRGSQRLEDLFDPALTPAETGNQGAPRPGA